MDRNDNTSVAKKRVKRWTHPGFRLYATVFVISFFLGLVVTGLYLIVADINSTLNRLS